MRYGLKNLLTKKNLTFIVAGLAGSATGSGVNTALAQNETCGPEANGVISAVSLEIVHPDTTETIPLITEKRPWGRDTGRPVYDGKRVLPVYANNPESIRWVFPDSTFDGKDGILLYGAAKNDSAQIDLNKELKDLVLDNKELSDLASRLGPNNRFVKWIAQSMKDGKTQASLEGSLYIGYPDSSSKTKTDTVTIFDKFLVELSSPNYSNNSDGKSSVGSEKVIDGKNYFLIGCTQGPNVSNGVYATLGMDNINDSKFGINGTVGVLGSNTDNSLEEHVINYVNTNRIHEFTKKKISENNALIQLGAGASYAVSKNIYLNIGAGMFLGSQETDEQRTIKITDLDGNLIGDGNPVSNNKTLEQSNSKAYISLGAHADLGKRWIAEGQYQRFGAGKTNTKGYGLKAGIGRRF